MRPKDAYKGKRRGRSDYTLNCSGGFMLPGTQGDRISVPLSPNTPSPYKPYASQAYHRMGMRRRGFLARMGCSEWLRQYLL